MVWTGQVQEFYCAMQDHKAYDSITYVRMIFSAAQDYVREAPSGDDTNTNVKQCRTLVTLVLCPNERLPPIATAREECSQDC